MNKRDRKQICNGLAKVCDLLYKEAVREAPMGKRKKIALKQAEEFKKQAKTFRIFAKI